MTTKVIDHTDPKGKQGVKKHQDVQQSSVAKTTQDLLDDVSAKGIKLDDATHDTIVRCLAEASSGDFVPLTQLVNTAIAKSTHKTHLLTYIKAHAPIKWSKKGDCFVSLGKTGLKAHPGYKVDDAANTPFWNWSAPRQDKQPFRAEVLIAKVRKTLDMAIASGEFNAHEQGKVRNGLSGVVYDYTSATANAAGDMVQAAGNLKDAIVQTKAVPAEVALVPASA